MQLSDAFVASFRLNNYDITAAWVLRVLEAQRANYQIDNPARFYGFGDINVQISRSIKLINECVDTINSHAPIIERKLVNIDDYDTLNYLHHIFEIYHGLLGQQNHEFFLTAPPQVKKALADLNICVHRCESVARGANKRHVVTYYGLPKTQTLSIKDCELLTDSYKFGTVYLNYVEIGKTLEDLAIDNDQYINEQAFKPFSFYSADFCVRLHDADAELRSHKHKLMQEFFSNNRDFFINKGYTESDSRLRPGSIPLAQLVSHDEEILQLLENRQYVKSVYFI